MTFIRDAAMAGQFYPGTAAELDTTVQNFLDAADAGQGPVPKAIIAPHAGYIYSGAIAASAYAQLIPMASVISANPPPEVAHILRQPAWAAPMAIFATPISSSIFLTIIPSSRAFLAIQ